MLVLGHTLTNKAVMSIRTNGAVAFVQEAIINPNSLKIEGFYCEDRFDKSIMVLLCQDIRDILPQGYFVNDHDVLSEPEELIRLKDIMDLQFDIVGKLVVTTSGTKIGKISDYAVETETMYVQKLYASRSILKSFTGGTLSIDRSQVNEITPKRIIINDLLKRSPSAATATV